MLDLERLEFLKTDMEEDWLDEQHSKRLSPEKSLMLAVLENAIHEALTPVTGQKKIRERANAKVWIQSRETEFVFCFNHICESLKIDPNAMRKGVMAQGGWSSMPNIH